MARPCMVCGNKNKGQLNRHHLIEKRYRRKGTRQVTVKLCREQKGCRAHIRFHEGDRHIAKIIRHSLKRKHLIWMVNKMNMEWVDKTYPY